MAPRSGPVDEGCSYRCYEDYEHTHRESKSEQVFERSEKCYWCHIKPFVLHDGYVYPCSSVVLNSDADGKFNDQYRWTKMEDLQDKYEEEMKPFSTDNCNHCVFKQQNDVIDMILHPVMENFV